MIAYHSPKFYSAFRDVVGAVPYKMMRYNVRYLYVPRRFFTRYGESMRIKCYFVERFGWRAPAVRLRSSCAVPRFNVPRRFFCGVFRVVAPENLRELFCGTVMKTFPYSKATKGTKIIKFYQTFTLLPTEESAMFARSSQTSHKPMR